MPRSLLSEVGWGVKLYIAGLALGGAALLAYTLPALPREALPVIVFLAFLGAIAQRVPVSLFASSSVSVCVAFAFSGLLLFGPAAAILINLPSILVHAIHPVRRPLHKTVFNLGLVSVAAGLSAEVYLASGGEVPIRDYLASVFPVALAALSYFLVQSVGVTVAILVSEGGSFAAIWRGNYRWLLLHYLGIGGISMGMAIAYRSVGPLGLLSFSLPLVMAWYSLRLYMARSTEVRAQNALLRVTNDRLEETFLSTIRALAAAADTKDHYTADHSAVAMQYAAETARQMGLDATTIATVQVGALFHDIGKIGIPETILRKPAPLADEEWLLMREHPTLGAKVIEQVAPLRDVLPALLHHHERFDGQGYPSKLSGTQIPLTAQIVAVVDAYQAITSDRPYRSAQSHACAIAELRRHAGTQFNPVVVEAFVSAREAALGRNDDLPQIDLSLLLRAQQPITGQAGSPA